MVRRARVLACPFYAPSTTAISSAVNLPAATDTPADLSPLQARRRWQRQSPLCYPFYKFELLSFDAVIMFRYTFNR
jgi:hypothetical protein